MKIALRYCGSCNPELDLSELGSRLTERALELGYEIASGPAVERAELRVWLCGCKRACLEQEDAPGADRVVLVRGWSLGWRGAPEDDLPGAILKAVAKLCSYSRV